MSQRPPVITDALVEHIRHLVGAIPPGRVATYGDIAAAAGLSSARTVGTIMRLDTGDLPWHRVVRADGKLPPLLRVRQRALLAAEGINLQSGSVPVAQYRHRFPA